MDKYFGTDGFRGEANKNLTFEHAILIGCFLEWYKNCICHYVSLLMPESSFIEIDGEML